MDDQEAIQTHFISTPAAHVIPGVAQHSISDQNT
ncbi:hypothetical protein O3G_MSEX000783 [Manduca sexta]|nr:hypothetical protein O3G_MSEX000783 [Manduca sexta]